MDLPAVPGALFPVAPGRVPGVETDGEVSLCDSEDPPVILEARECLAMILVHCTASVPHCTGPSSQCTGFVWIFRDPEHD